MTDLNTLPFITINQQTLSLGRALQYLQVAGKLMPLLQEVVALHLIFETLQERSEVLTVENSEIEQHMIDFRIRENLTDAEQFQTWLKHQGMEYETFVQRVWLALQIEQLKLSLVHSNEDIDKALEKVEPEQRDSVQRQLNDYRFKQWLAEKMNGLELGLAIAS